MRCLITLRIKLNRVIQIVYPFLVYFIVYQLGVALLIDIIGDKYGQLVCLLIAALVCLIPMYVIYLNTPKLIPEQIINKKLCREYFLWVVGVVVGALIINVILTKSGIINYSQGFNNASETLSDGSTFIKLCCNCLVIPILEELLMRGIIVGQLYMWYGIVPAVIISSFCFGIIHNNIVQFIYAVIVGMGLGVMYCKTKRLSLCILAHCLINFIVIMFS